jgi:WD40 repeat protein
MLASASGKTIRLWNVETHKQVGQPLDHPGNVASVAFSPDGRMLASASRTDKTVRLWDVRTHRQLGQPLDQPGNVASVAFSPDGHTLASTTDDQTIRLWDVHAHKQVGSSLTGHTNFIDAVVFSPDGRTLASASFDKTVRLWERILWRDFAELQTEACRLVGSGLSTTEWAQYAASIPYRQSCP